MTGFRALLLTAVTSTRTHFSDFKRAHSKDPRFREFGKTEGEREKVFKGWLRELGERKRAEAQKAEERFVEMLKADALIKEGDKWTDVRCFHLACVTCPFPDFFWTGQDPSRLGPALRRRQLELAAGIALQQAPRLLLFHL